MLTLCTAAMIWLGTACPFDVPGRHPGDNVTYGPSFLVRFMTPEQAEQTCHELGIPAEARACAFWRMSDDTSAPLEIGDGLSMPKGYKCVVITPPYQTMLDHELRHCREGDYHAPGVYVRSRTVCVSGCDERNVILVFYDTELAGGTIAVPVEPR